MTDTTREPRTALLREHVIDCDGLVWRLVRDGGMATRAHYSGIESIGIETLRATRGPLTNLGDAIEAEAAPPPAEAVEALRALVDAVDEQLRPAQAVGGWGDSPLSQAVDEAHRIMAALPTSPPALDVERLAPTVLEGMLLLQRERGRLSKVSVEDVARLLTVAARLAEQPKEAQP